MIADICQCLKKGEKCRLLESDFSIVNNLSSDNHSFS